MSITVILSLLCPLLALTKLWYTDFHTLTTFPRNSDAKPRLWHWDNTCILGLTVMITRCNGRSLMGPQEGRKLAAANFRQRASQMKHWEKAPRRRESSLTFSNYHYALHLQRVSHSSLILSISSPSLSVPSLLLIFTLSLLPVPG